MPAFPLSCRVPCASLPLQNGLRVLSASSSSTTTLSKELAALVEQISAVVQANKTLEQHLEQHERDVQQQAVIATQLRREVDMHHAALAAPATHVRLAAHDHQLHNIQQMLNDVLDAKPSNKRARSASRSPSPMSPEPTAPGNGSGPSSPAPEPMSKLERMRADMDALKALLAEKQVSHVRVPDLPKPPVFSGHASQPVEDHIFVFETYLSSSNIPVEN